MKKLALHWKILIGMFLGVIFGFVMASTNGQEFVMNWIGNTVNDKNLLCNILRIAVFLQ